MKKIVSLIFVASLYIGVSPTYVFAQNIFTKPACGTEVNC